MDIPKDLKFSAVTFSSLVNGGHQQVFRNEEYGITVEHIKENRDKPWVKIFTVDRFPDRVFNSGKEVTEAFKEITK